ncbi:MAG: FtsX-like permease family protein [Elusimicrobiota bacterium]|nr:FtsX-like permease family protein [Elusimicrobiota bacterium]
MKISFLLKLAWRNNLRNKRRTFLVSLMVGLGLAALIFVDGMSIGMADNIVKSATGTFLGHAQIHREGFRNSNDIDLAINESDRVLKELAQDEKIESFAPRALSFSMLASASNSDSIMLYGIDAEKEKNISRINDFINKGEFLKEDGQNEIVIGSELAESLEVGIDEHIIVTVAQYKTGELSQGRFRITGIFHSNSKQMDKSLAFINLSEFHKLLAMNGEIHEIAVKFKDFKEAESDFFSIRYSKKSNEALSWPALMPEVMAASKMSAIGILITATILFMIVSLGIMNTLFMAIFERVFEFGILRSIGTRPFQLALMIVLEAVMIALTSIALGSLIGFAAVHIVGINGLNYNGIEFAGATFLEPVIPVSRLFQYIVYPSVLMMFTVLISFYPAFYASKITPLKAMRKSL